VPGDDRRPARSEVALHDVEIRPADAAAREAQEDVPGARDEVGHLLEDERTGFRGGGTVEPEGAHPRKLGPAAAESNTE
jgi:hypothetical protein